MHRVTRRELPIFQDYPLRPLNDGTINREHLVSNTKQRIERALDRVTTVNRDMTVQDLLQHFRIGNQGLAVADQSFEQSLRIAFVGMGRADQIHWNV
jgi:hypothetical protein